MSKISNMHRDFMVILHSFLLASVTQAAYYQPSPLGNTDAVSGLIYCINEANSTTDDDVIDLGGVSYQFGTAGFSGSEDLAALNTTALPPITSIVTSGNLFIANGSIERSLQIGTPDFRLLYAESGAGLFLFDLTIENGSIATGDNNGGALHNSGVLYVESCTFINNFATGLGGGLYNDGTILQIDDTIISGNSVTTTGPSGDGGGIYNLGIINIINNSTISHNFIDSSALSANLNGAGIFNSGSGLVGFSNSTISDNYITGTTLTLNADGIGIYNDGAMSINNCTVANNIADPLAILTGNGGGIYNNGPLSINNATISGNNIALTLSQGFGGGIYNDTSGAISSLVSNIVANNFASFAPDIDNLGSISVSSEGYNLITSTQGNAIVNGVNNDIVTTAATLFLGPLQHNGGFTFTMALLPGSFAINNGNNDLNGFTYDQRGAPYQRAVRSLPDIGAYELQ